ncbi:AMP-dependent synthetase/ligase [Nitrospira defluvii]|uniref:Long-chain fatty acid--CoA ligase n=1 Tax=Nitrospira defluvii TaxID=330214 RepID=A0ABM8R9M5_9BACT|nr:AMP-dependent synthetase/ligase [Nitrospira defluvii]CAE6740544.1 Long-chain fatty acid--CoA ligase [Nitrospira defluvii]
MPHVAVYPSPDSITTDDVTTLPELFRLRCQRSPEREAYRQCEASVWRSYSWREVEGLVARWQLALAGENLASGDRVAVLLKNSVEWVCFDLAAQSLGLAVVPLYAADHENNTTYILADSGARLLLVGHIDQWFALAGHRARFPQLSHVLCLETACTPVPATGIQVSFIKHWLPSGARPQVNLAKDTHALATIVYTSGTTGRPKGVMLSHFNILSNAQAVITQVQAYPEDLFLSFLPLSHAFERTVGCYLPMMAGSCVAYARAINKLAEDIAMVRPTILVSVPRIYERMYVRLQNQLGKKCAMTRALFHWAQEIGWRHFQATRRHGEAPGRWAALLRPVLQYLVADKFLARFGGRLRLAVSGGAPLSLTLSQCFVGLGVPLVQGYGLTEAAPVVTSNRPEDNLPESVGIPLPGVEVRLGEQNELLVRGPNVMMGYWNRPEDTARAINAEGWLHTGDQARIENGYVFIVGRLKEIVVLSTGEKIVPEAVEMALVLDPLIDQAMVVGEGKPYLAALLVLNAGAWRSMAQRWSLPAEDPAALADVRLQHHIENLCHRRLASVPEYAQVRRFWLTLEPWTLDNDLVTPTLKLKRPAIEQRFAEHILKLYSGHLPPA